MFLEFSDLGLPAWTGSTTSKQSNADIISSLGVGIVWFDERPPEGEIEAPDVEYRVDTDVITSVTLRTDTYKPSYDVISWYVRTEVHAVYIASTDSPGYAKQVLEKG